MSRRIALGLAWLLGAWPGIASAGPGALEINAACAAVGCFAGDAAGFPVTITAPGSYVLTANLEVPALDTTAILVSASDVSLDLGGFAIRGPNACAGAPAVCGIGTGRGIDVDDESLRRRLAISNGAITGMGGGGLRAGTDCLVTRLRVAWNGGAGVQALGACVASDVVASENGAAGLILQFGVVAGSVAERNGGRGINVTGVAVGNAASENGEHGILAGIGSAVLDNVSSGNVGDGIVTNGYSVVAGNASRLNGGDGVRTNAIVGLWVQSNVIGENDGFGLNLAADDAYTENAIVDNAAGTVAGGVSRGANFCDGAATPGCP